MKEAEERAALPRRCGHLRLFRKLRSRPYPSSGEGLTTVISPNGHRRLRCLGNLPKDAPRLTGGIRFVNFNSPFTVILPNQVLQHESVAANLDFGVPGSVWLEVPVRS